MKIVTFNNDNVAQNDLKFLNGSKNEWVVRSINKFLQNNKVSNEIFI
jgi:hypothetical protein